MLSVSVVAFAAGVLVACVVESSSTLLSFVSTFATRSTTGCVNSRILSHKERRPLLSRLGSSRSVSEDDLFENESFYGGKSYGRTYARRSRHTQTTTTSTGIVDEEDAWEQFYSSGSSKKKDDERNFSERSNDAFNAICEHAKSIIAVQSWNETKLDAENTELQQQYHYLRLLQDAVNLVSHDLVERSEEARLVVLAMLANEHILLLGSPGTGKSEIGRRLSQICGGYFFQRLLTRFTTTEELFGPLSLKALENDEYRRITEGYLAGSSIAFLDEIFKANSAILNTLLTVLNERKFDNGGAREDCAIRCVVGASNELPEDEGLDALYDRFLIRKEVKPVSDDGLLQLLSMGTLERERSEKCELIASEFDEMISNISELASAVKMPDDVCNILCNMRIFMRDEMDSEISDRRLVKAARILRISAASNGRKSVDPIDLLLMQHIVWRLPEQRAVVQQWLWDNLTPGGEGNSADIHQYRFLLNGLKKSAGDVIRNTGGDIIGDGGARASDLATIAALREELSNISNIIKRRFDSLARHRELLYRASEHCWLSGNEALAAKQLLLPLAERSIAETKELLLESHIMGHLLATTNDSSLTVENDVRLSIIDRLLKTELTSVKFSDKELQLSAKKAKQNYDTNTFRAWKKAKKTLARGGIK